MVQAFLRAAQGTGLQIVDIALSTSLESELDEILRRVETLDVDTVFVSQYDAYYAFDILQRVRGINPRDEYSGGFFL